MPNNIIKRQDGSIILIPSYLIQHISTHNAIGSGSVFATPPTADDIFKAASAAPVTGQGGLYQVSMSGYNLVLSILEALKLPNAKQGSVKKEERNAQIEVPSVSTSAPLSQFSTNQSNIVIRTTPAEYIPEEFKTNQEIVAAAGQGKLYSVLAMFPGDPNIPPASKWNGQFAVILPNQKGQEQPPQNPSEQPAQITPPNVSYFLNNYIGKLGITSF